MDLAAHLPLDLHAKEAKKYHTYVQIAMTLAVITGMEIVVIYIPFIKWFIITTLVLLSFVKFMLVIFYFMHLRWDKAFCTILFFIGLVLAGGTMWALLSLFGAPESLPTPLSALDPAPITWTANG